MIKSIMQKIFRRPFLLFFIAWLTLVHGGLVYLKVSNISSSEYAKYAMDIRVTDTTRYGYVLLYHGAHLVCTKNTPGALPRMGTDADADQDLTLKAVMLQQLRWYPLKAIFETVLYILIVGYVFFWAAKLRHRFAPEDASCLRKVSFEALMCIFGWTLVVFPLLAFSYGESLYSTWAGPGALSGSSPSILTGISAETISYRPLLEALCLFPMFFTETIGLQHLLPEMSVGMTAWTAGILAFGTAGVLFQSVKCIFRYKEITWK